MTGARRSQLLAMRWSNIDFDHLDLDQDQHRAILRRYREITRPEVPIRAVVRPGQRTKYADLVAAFDVWEHEPTVSELDGFAAGVEAADRYT